MIFHVFTEIHTFSFIRFVFFLVSRGNVEVGFKEIFYSSYISLNKYFNEPKMCYFSYSEYIFRQWKGLLWKISFRWRQSSIFLTSGSAVNLRETRVNIIRLDVIPSHNIVSRFHTFIILRDATSTVFARWKAAKRYLSESAMWGFCEEVGMIVSFVGSMSLLYIYTVEITLKS